MYCRRLWFCASAGNGIAYLPSASPAKQIIVIKKIHPCRQKHYLQKAQLVQFTPKLVLFAK
jgi:hypothetical protein